MIPKDLLIQADHLANLSPKRPKQANLRRSVSSAYYAVFHALCFSNANSLAGKGANKLSGAWLQTYRAVDHGKAKKLCKDAGRRGFPVEITDFAAAFISLQEHRHRADYNPETSAHYTKKEVSGLVSVARSAVTAIENASLSDRKAFAIHLLLQYRE